MKVLRKNKHYIFCTSEKSKGINVLLNRCQMINTPRIANKIIEAPVSTSSGESSLSPQIIKKEAVRNTKKQLTKLN